MDKSLVDKLNVKWNRYMRWNPTPKQLAFLMYNGSEMLYGGSAGSGKGQPIDSRSNLTIMGLDPDNPSHVMEFKQMYEGKVLTPFGFVGISEVQVGTKVCNPDGSVAEVIAIKDNGFMDCYKVTFADGGSVIVDESHQWVYWTARKRKNAKNDLPSECPEHFSESERFNHHLMTRCSVTTTKKLYEMVNDRDTNFLIPITNPLKMTTTPGRWKILPPYTLGVLLGDGNMTSTSYRITKPDLCIFDHVETELKEAGFTDKIIKPSGKEKDITARIVGDGVTRGVGRDVAEVVEVCKRLGVHGLKSHEKFIPRYYKTAPIDVRWAVVQGLMDTDGCSTEGSACEFSTTSEQLANDLRELLGSLGFVVTIGEKEEPVYEHKGEKRIGRKAYRLYIKGNNCESLFRIERKKKRTIKFNGGASIAGRRIVSITKMKKQLETRCIQVSHPNSLYVTNDFIVTHNSAVLLLSALQYADVPGYSAIIFRQTLTELKGADGIIPKAESLLGPFLQTKEVKYIGSEHAFYFKTFNKDGSPGEPSRLEFGYIGMGNAHTKYQGRAYQFCVHPDTRVWMGDLAWKPIKDIEVGDCVMTSMGPPQSVAEKFEIVQPAVKLVSSKGEQIQSKNHRVLIYDPERPKEDGKLDSEFRGYWESYDSLLEKGITKVRLLCMREEMEDTEGITVWTDHPYRDDFGWFANYELVDATIEDLHEEIPMIDIRVKFASMYATSWGIVNSNCGWDELTHHAQKDYEYLFSRRRKAVCPIHQLKDGSPYYVAGCDQCEMRSSIPLRTRAATNPGGFGASWVKKWFKIEPNINPEIAAITGQKVEWIGKNPEAPFLPAKLSDNPFIDQKSYAYGLSKLDETTRKQLQDGDWGEGGSTKFKRHWFHRWSSNGDHYILGRDRINEYGAFRLSNMMKIFLSVDTAASVAEGQLDTVLYPKKEPSWTVIGVFALTPTYHLLWLDIDRFQEEVPEVIKRCIKMWNRWAHCRPEYALVESKGTGIAVYQELQRANVPVKAVRPFQDKVVRATPAMMRAEMGRLWLPQEAWWLKDLEDELFGWQGYPSETDDQVDVLSQAVNDIDWPENLELVKGSFYQETENVTRFSYIDQSNLPYEIDSSLWDNI